jgi:hypothetical protein
MDRTARMSLWSVFVIGALFVVMPFAISLPSKASAGQNMLNGFHPLMQPAAVQTAANYYNVDFVPLGSVATGGVQAAKESPMLMSARATQLHMTSAQMQQFMGKNFPAVAQLLGSFPQMVPIFQQVPSGLTFYKPLIATMQAQDANYAKVDSPPNFNLFTWFFVVPGILLLLLSSVALLCGRHEHLLAVDASPAGVRDAVKSDKVPASV